MLAPEQRLTAAGEFRQVSRRGHRGAAASLALHLLVTGPAGTDPESTGPRAGFVVSKAVGNAVVRNRVKRRLRHLVREQLDGLPPCSRLVVRALPPAASATYAQLGADLDAALARAQEKAHQKARQPA